MTLPFSSPSAAESTARNVADLGRDERLVLRGFRGWVLGLRANAGAPCTIAWTMFASDFGAEAGRAIMVALVAVIAALAAGPRRPLRLHPPCCPRLGHDELALLGLLDACRQGHWALARARAEWLVEANGVGDLLAAMSRLARTLSDSTKTTQPGP